MRLFRFLICLGILVTSSQAIAISDNPFDKAVVVTAGNDVSWQFGEQTATKSVKGSDGTWYHLFYDGLRLRLRLTGSAEDSQYGARQFEDFAVNDVRIDGNRVELFQWCLNNQDKHSRFLQQGLTVKKEICQNQGEQGTFIMRLTKDTIASLNSGNVIEYELKPFRTTVKVKFNIDDFDKVNSEFKKQQAAKLAADKAAKEKAKAEASAAAAAAAPAAAAIAVKPKPEPKAKCMVGPPEGFSAVKIIEYDCDDAAARTRAQAAVDSKVSAIKAERKKAAAEAERKRKEAEAARLAKEEALKKEQEALAASAALRAELSSDIAKKMIAVCEKKWAEGEHRCYCEKYIEFAPPNITSNPDCK
jgi:hypothetical protein